MKKSFIFSLLLITGLMGVKAQCFVSTLPSFGRALGTSGSSQLDQIMLNEAYSLAETFGVTVDYDYYDDSSGPNAFASCQCSSYGCEGTIRFGQNLLWNEIYSHRGGQYAAIGVLAHEFGHVMQCKYGWSGIGKAKELHADFLAGYYMGRRQYYAYTDIEAFAQSLFAKGDYDFWNPRHHGTPHERVQFMVLGARCANMSPEQAYVYGQRIAIQY